MRKSILKTTVILAVVSFSFLTFSCDKPLSSSLFDQQTVETSRKNAMVTITLNAGAVNSSLEAEWKLGNEKVTTRTLTGVIGTPLGIDNPTLYGYACAGWINDDIPGDTPKKLETFPEESGSYTAVWGDVVKALRLQRNRIGLEAGENTTFNAEHLPSEIIDPFLFWTSSNPNAVEVTQDGKATVKAGAAVGATSVIRVEAASGEYAECEIVVIEKESFFERVGRYNPLSSNSVSFGSYPQSFEKNIKKIYGEEDGPRNGAYVTLKWGGMTYYWGTDSCWYARVNSADPAGFETYNDGTAIDPGKRCYFRVEPIKWQIVTTAYEEGNGTKNKKLLLAEKGLENGISFYAGKARTIGGKTIYQSNWEYSNMRAYLNGKEIQDMNWSGKGFLQTAFTTKQQKLIQETNVDNSVNSMEYYPAKTFDTNGNITNENPTPKDTSYFTYDERLACNNTNDQIFLVSVTEICGPENKKDDSNYKNKYGFPSGHTGTTMRVRQPTDYAIAKNAEKSGSGTVWFLRSPVMDRGRNGAPYFSSTVVRVISGGGYAKEFYASEYAKTIVPALCVE